MKYIVNVEVVLNKNVVVDAECADEAEKIVSEEFCMIDFDINDDVTQQKVYSVIPNENNEAEENGYQEI